MAARNMGTNDAPAEGAPGIIDTLGAAFAALNRRPHLVWLPIALDAFLWLGLRFSPVGVAAFVSRTASEAPAGFAALAERSAERLASSDLFVLATMLIPTLLTALGRGDIDSLRDAPALSGSLGAESAGLVTLLIGGIILGMTYLTTVGRLVQGEPAWGRTFVWLCVANSWRLFGFVVVLTLILALLGFPVAVLAVGLAFAGVNPTTLITMCAVTLGVWAAVFFFFGQYAIAIWSASPLEALRSSYVFVIRHLAHVLGFILVFVVIRTGTSVALRVLTESPWSVPLALVINAYVATMLVAAAMMFFRDRSSEFLPRASSSDQPIVQTH